MRRLIASPLLALPLAASAASFDCAKASHAVEKLVCANPVLSKLDEDMAQAFKQRLALVIDKTAMRGQQKDWNAVLRSRCTKGCDAAEVERQYREQIDSLRGEWEESWSDSYKTNDPAFMDLTVKDASSFIFRLSRIQVDDVGEKPLCLIPGPDKPPLTARLIKDKGAQWSQGGCTLDFAFERDARGSVVAIQVSSRGCEKSCTAPYLPDGRYSSENNWVAGNQ